MPRNLLILGTRIFAEEVADLAEEVEDIRVAGFVENMERERCATPLLGLPVHWIDDLADLVIDHVALCALGTTHRIGFIEQAAARGLRFTTLVHPSARVSPNTTLGEGCIVSAGALIAARSRLGKHVIVNRGALIGHHTEIGDCVTIGPGANVAGKCRVGNGAYIAMSAVLLDRVSIGADAIVGAGAVVTKDVPENVQVLGVPARITKENVGGR